MVIQEGSKKARGRRARGHNGGATSCPRPPSNPRAQGFPLDICRYDIRALEEAESRYYSRKVRTTCV